MFSQAASRRLVTSPGSPSEASGLFGYQLPGFIQNIHIADAGAGAEYGLQIRRRVSAEHRLVEGDGGEGIIQGFARCHHFKQIVPKGSRFGLTLIGGSACEIRGFDGEFAADSGGRTSRGRKSPRPYARDILGDDEVGGLYSTNSLKERSFTDGFEGWR